MTECGTELIPTAQPISRALPRQSPDICNQPQKKAFVFVLSLKYEYIYLKNKPSPRRDTSYHTVDTTLERTARQLQMSVYGFPCISRHFTLITYTLNPRHVRFRMESRRVLQSKTNTQKKTDKHLGNFN